MRLSKRLLLRVTVAVAGALAVAAAVAGPAYADLGDSDDSSDSAFWNDSSDDAGQDADDSPDEDADARAAEDGDDREPREESPARAQHLITPERVSGNHASAERGSERHAAVHDEEPAEKPAEEPADPPKKTRQHKHEGIYGLDKDPGSLAQDNLDGRTDPPGFYYPGLGTIEAPGVATR